MPVDSPQNLQPLKEQLELMVDVGKNSTSKKGNTFSPKPSVRNGFRRKKGDSPLVYNVSLKTKKEKKQESYTNPDPWARLCLLYTSPSPRDATLSRMPSSA